MLFNSIDFLLFFPLVTAVYFFLPHRARWVWLLAASYYFYMCWNVKYALLIALSTLITYASGLLIHWRRKRLWVLLSFASNLAILFFFKYFGFFLDNLTAALALVGVAFKRPAFDVILPVGISFYTFQALSYTMDVYRGEVEPERNPFRYALFVSFFPQLVAGPIERSKNLLGQLYERHDFDPDRARDGMLLMLWGMFEKIVIADRLALLVDYVYDHYAQLPGATIVLATVFFAFQIYCDFGGYSDIARGCAKMMGVDLMVNFKSPYFFSHSISNYWQRNHISLSQWFTEYVYIPLGGSRKGRAKQYLFTTITFFLSGLWHGAEWSFVIWGLLQAVYINLERACHRSKEPPKPPPLHLLAILTTFALSCFSLIFFRAANTGDALYVVRHALWGIGDPAQYCKNLLTNLTGLEAMGLGLRQGAFLLGALLLLFLFDLADERTDAIAMVSRWPLAVRWGCYLGLALIVLIFGVYGPGYDVRAFAYFQF